MSWQTEQIIEATLSLKETVPPDVTIVAAAKQRSAAEVEAVIQAGITHIGHNYIQEAQQMIPEFPRKATWHLIGHLQRNKAGLASRNFDMIESLDSLKLAIILEQQCARLEKIMPVFIEVNSGREMNKSGIFPENIISFINSLPKFTYIQVEGLMTIGPVGGIEELKEAFITTRRLFNDLRSEGFPHIHMRYLSMGMSDSYRLAIDEGSNMIRIGNKLFGPRIRS